MVAGFLWGGRANLGCFSKTLRAHISESTLTKYAIIWQIFFSDHIDQMCKFSSKSGGVPFQISFFLGDLTRNDPIETFHLNFMKHILDVKLSTNSVMVYAETSCDLC